MKHKVELTEIRERAIAYLRRKRRVAIDPIFDQALFVFCVVEAKKGHNCVVVRNTFASQSEWASYREKCVDWAFAHDLIADTSPKTPDAFIISGW